jgi:hypothetical protein
MKEATARIKINKLLQAETQGGVRKIRKTTIAVQGAAITVLSEQDFICLTDIAKHKKSQTDQIMSFKTGSATAIPSNFWGCGSD